MKVDHQFQKSVKTATGHYLLAGGGKFLYASQGSYYKAGLGEQARYFQASWNIELTSGGFKKNISSLKMLHCVQQVCLVSSAMPGIGQLL